MSGLVRAGRWAAFALSLGVAGQAASMPSDTQRVPQARIDWQADLDYLVATFERVHANPWHATPRLRFEAKAQDLSRRIPHLSPSEIRAEFAALVAMVGEAHSRVNLLVPGGPGTPSDPTAGFVPVPIIFYSYDDGIYVKSAAISYGDLVGARLVSVGGMPVTEVVERLERFVHRDNEMTLRSLLPAMLTRPAFLKAAGVTDSLGMIPALFDTASGRRSVELSPAPGADRTAVDAYRPGGEETRPLWLRHNDRPYWMEAIGDGRTLYIQFNVVRNRGEEDLATFAQRVESSLADADISRVVVDLRHNDGGNFVEALPLVDVLDRFDESHGPGSLFVAINRTTFSAASHLAALLEARTDAVFVGEPTGARPNTYGDMDGFILPSSGLSISYSERYFQPADPYDDRPWIDPDLSTPFTSADYAAGRDPVLEAIDRHSSGEDQELGLAAAARTAPVEEVLAIYEAYRARPDKRHAWFADDLTEVGHHYWRSGQLASSLPVWTALARDFPQSPEGLENLAETHQALGNRAAAVEALFRAIAAHPFNKGIVELVWELCGPDAAGYFVKTDPANAANRAGLQQQCEPATAGAPLSANRISSAFLTPIRSGD